MLDKVRASKDSGFILKIYSSFFCVESAFLIFKVSCSMLFLKLVFLVYRHGFFVLYLMVNCDFPLKPHFTIDHKFSRVLFFN